MGSRGSRINFSEKTKQVVAGRSGYSCSYPGCETLTIGPAKDNEEVSRTGVAAHIYSAAPKGPRGQGLLTEPQLRSPDNAIWLCPTHSTLIDKNRGTAYPPAVLVSYKALHEAAIARRHRGLHAPLGWLHELRITGGPLFRTPASIHFGQLTFLAGANASGRSSVCEWITAISDPAWGLRRWRNTHGYNEPVSFEATVFTPTKFVVGIHVADSSRIRFELNGEPIPYNPIPTRVITIIDFERARIEDHERAAWENWSDLRRISAALHIDEVSLENILPQTGADARIVQKVWTEMDTKTDDESDEDYVPRELLKVKLRHHGFSLSFLQLSTSEKALVLIELGIALASFSAQYVPTVLVLDSFSLFDQFNRAELVARIGSSECLFQTIIEVGSEDGNVKFPIKPTWEVVSFVGTLRDVQVYQLGAGVQSSDR
jgi:hypothetical protein